ncbi:hypothetical protein HMPREF3226_00775, partial [Prevotella corporis]
SRISGRKQSESMDLNLKQEAKCVKDVRKACAYLQQSALYCIG